MSNFNLFMATETIKDIIKAYPDLHQFTISKPSKDRSTWVFKVNDPTSVLNGTCSQLSSYNYRITTLQRGSHFFLTYKIYINENDFEYFIDPKKCIHRSSPKKYLESILNYLVYSNDISPLKNDPSFKYTQVQMFRDDINNYLDLCHKFQDYSSIGTGLTRDIRNLVVMDIDVNCENQDNKEELDRLIVLFSKHNFTPNFYIFNHESKHVQLQWLIKDLDYKDILWKQVNEKIAHFEKTSHQNKEISLNDFNFMELSKEGVKYRKFTRGLAKLSSKRKFGDENYTFWKAKNFYTAYLGKFNLELKMPVVINDEVEYLTREEMSYFFETKEARQAYYDISPTMDEVYERTSSFMTPHMETISESSLKKIKDDVVELEEPFEMYDFRNKFHDVSRNAFVFNSTRMITWDVMRDNNYNSKNDVLNLSQKNQKAFRSKVKKIVKQQFDEEDRKYMGEWPGTTNHSKYTQSEFNSTFNRSFDFAIHKFKNNSYDEAARDKSLEERVLKKELRHVLIIYLKTCVHPDKKIKNYELLKMVNGMLVESGHVKISNSTLKRDLKEIEEYEADDKKNLFTHVLKTMEERSSKLQMLYEKGSDKKEINVCKKRMNRLKIGDEHVNGLKEMMERM